MKTILSFTLALLPVLTWAQGMKPAGTSADDIVPEGWQKQKVRGDLNKDGFEDLVIIATPDNAENMLTRDDGYVYNFNQPLLAVYFGTGDGSTPTFSPIRLTNTCSSTAVSTSRLAAR